MSKNHFRKEFDIQDEIIGKKCTKCGSPIILRSHEQICETCGFKSFGKILCTPKEFYEEIRIEGGDIDYEEKPPSPKKTERRLLDLMRKISNHLKLSKNIRNTAEYYFKKILRNEKKVINSVPLIGFCIFYAVIKESRDFPNIIIEISNAFQDFGYKIYPRFILRDGIRYKRHLTSNAAPHNS